MKTWMKIGLIVLAVGIIAAVLIYILYINKPHKDIEGAAPDYTLAAGDLYKSFTIDKKLSDSLYNGKVIELSGKIDKIETNDSLVIAVFVYSKDDFGDAGIRCTMLAKYNEEAKKITSGAAIRIKGLCSGYNDSDVILEKCSIIKE